MQELFCHACGKYVQFETPDDVHANVSLSCPNCGHMHYRVVRYGRITRDRWASANRRLPVFQINRRQTTFSSSSTSTGSTVAYMRSYGTTSSTTTYSYVTTA